MQKTGISVVGIIVFIALIGGIAWGLDYIINKDYVVLRPSIAANMNKNTVTSEIPLTHESTISTSSPQTPATTSENNISTSTKETATTTPKGPTSMDMVVTLTDKGFTPANLTIKKGQTVVFMNMSSGKMWVAANPFPSSSEYPDFNEKTGIDKNRSWSFTFDKSGVWFYHNHYSPATGGKIVVNAK